MATTTAGGTIRVSVEKIRGLETTVAAQAEKIAALTDVKEKWYEIDQVNQATIADLQLNLDREKRAHEAENAQRRTAEAERNTVINELSALKIELAEVLSDNARLKGYIDRVQEMDEAQRLPVHLSNNEVHPAPPLPRRGAGRGRDEVWYHQSGGPYFDTDIGPSSTERKPPRRHWTSYGQ